MPSPDPASVTDVVCPPDTSRVEKQGDHREVRCETAHHRKEGPSLEWYPNGNLRSAGSYHWNELRHGWWRDWNQDGSLRSEVEYHLAEWVARRRLPSEGEARASRPGDAVHPCPEGSFFAKGVAPDPGGEWCETPRADGAWVREGPWLELRNDRVQERGHFHAGLRDGQFEKEWLHESQTYSAGELVAMTTWDERGTKRTEMSPLDGGLSLHRRWRADGSLEGEEVKRGQKRVHATFFYREGGKSLEESRRDEKLEGVWRSWWRDGQLHEEGEYRDGHKIGVWNTWSAAGELLRRDVYGPQGRSSREILAVSTALPDGWPFRTLTPIPLARAGEAVCRAPAKPFSETTASFTARGCAVSDGRGPIELVTQAPPLDEPLPPEFRQGRLAETVPLLLALLEGHEPVLVARNGKLEGTLRIWDAAGRENSELDFHDGVYEGRQVLWNGDGSLQKISSWVAGKKQGPFASWWPNGAPRACGTAPYSPRNGVFIECPESGHCRKREEYRDGQPAGTWIDWFESGGKRRESSYRDGKLEGLHTAWDDDGRVVEQGQYLAGKKTGRWKTGKGEENWLDGQRDGDWTFRGEAGEILLQGRYERGRRVGEWKRYDPRGHLVEQGEYAWCESPPELSVTPVPGGEESVEWGMPLLEGCKKGRWSLWKSNGELWTQVDFDETDPRKRAQLASHPRPKTYELH